MKRSATCPCGQKVQFQNDPTKNSFECPKCHKQVSIRKPADGSTAAPATTTAPTTTATATPVVTTTPTARQRAWPRPDHVHGHGHDQGRG